MFLLLHAIDWFWQKEKKTAFAIPTVQEILGPSTDKGEKKDFKEITKILFSLSFIGGHSSALDNHCLVAKACILQ